LNSDREGKILHRTLRKKEQENKKKKRKEIKGDREGEKEDWSLKDNQGKLLLSHLDKVASRC